MQKRRIMVLGSTGMLGHKVVQACATRFETVAVSRTALPATFAAALPDATFLDGVDVTDFNGLRELITSFRPDVVVNCVGIVKQLAAARDPIPSITVNALLPHQIADACRAIGCRLIQISTDCVFRGARGGYLETDFPDADDLYGRTKLLGEVTSPGCLTLRTSIIGRELRGAAGLVEWFLSSSGPVKGYAEAWFSGLTTLELSELIARLCLTHDDLNGLWHVSADRINKHELLLLLAAAFGKTVDVIEEHSVVIDRSLDSTRFCEATGFRPPSWPDMIARLAADTTDYEVIRRT